MVLGDLSFMVQRRRNNKKWLWWGGGVVLVALIVAIGVVIWQNSNSENKENDTEVVEVEKQETTEVETVETGELASTGVEKEKVVQYEGNDPNEAEELTGVVTYAGVAGNTLMIRVSIDQYLTEGTCELTLSRGGATMYSSIASIIGDVSAATCEGFDVPAGELGGGDVQININLSAGERKGVIRGEASI